MGLPTSMRPMVSSNSERIPPAVPQGERWDLFKLHMNAHAAANEDIFLLEPDTSLKWGVAGYTLGNLHRPVRFS